MAVLGEQEQVGNEAVLKWSQALTTQMGGVLYFGCGVVCVCLNHTGALRSAETSNKIG